jgi:hypothetical protein
MLLKFLLIVGLILYCVYKIGNMFFRAGAASQQFRNPQGPQYGQNFNCTPKKEPAKPKFNGGEYIDYEEIKK